MAHRERRSTIRDVGRAAGVSIGTVSKALNGSGSVSDDTVRKVREAADMLGYRPSKAAQGLVGGRSFQVGYGLPVLGGWGNPTLDAFLHAMVGAAGEHGLDIVLFKAEPHGVGPYEDLIKRRVVDAFVLSDTDYEDARVDFLLEKGVPFATFGRTARSERHYWVDVDGAEGTAQTTRHLASRGHSRFGVIAWPEGSETGDLRLTGVTGALRSLGLPPPSVVRSTNGIEPGRQAMAELLRIAPATTAVVCVQDELALGALAYARSSGIDVGSVMAIAGFDDTPTASIVDPPLTTVRQPFGAVGSVLGEILGEALEGSSPRGVLLEPTLVVRASTEGGSS